MTWLVSWVVGSVPLAFLVGAVMGHRPAPVTPFALAPLPSPAHFDTDDLDAELRELLRAGA
jgi:hypothetical protein